MRDDLDELLDLTTNPADRLWRYPLGRWAVRYVMDTPLTPHHVTALHAALGVAAGAIIAQGSLRAWILAGLLYELRSILDCFDGVVARAKKLSSPMGRALDETADAVGFAALMLGTMVCLARAHGWPAAVAETLLCTLISASCTAAWDFFKRRFTSLLREGRDTTGDDFLALSRDFAQRPAFSLAVAKAVAVWQWTTLDPAAYSGLRARARRGDYAPDPADRGPSPLAGRLREAAARRDPALRATLLRVGFVAGDNVILLLTVGLLVGQPVRAVPLAMAYGLVAWCVTVWSVRRLLGDHRAAAHAAR